MRCCKRIGAFERNSVTILMLSMVANVVNYLFQIVTGRMLSVEDYGVVNTLLSIINIFGVPATVLSMTAGKLSIAMDAEEESEIYYETMSVLRRVLMILAVITLLAGVLFCFLGAQIWSISYHFFIGIVVASIVALVSSVSKGVIQAREKFWEYGIQNIIMAGAKLLFSLIFIAVGCRVWGVMAGMIVANILTWGYCVYVLGGFKGKREHLRKQGSMDGDKMFYKAMLLYLSVILLANGDLLLTRALMDETSAGLYASATNLARIAMYVSSAIATTMFPMVARQNQNGETTVPILKKSLIYGGIVAVMCIGSLLFLGAPIINFIFGERYSDAYAYLPIAGCYVIPVTLLMILANYLIALDRIQFFLASFCVCGTAILLWVWMCRNNIEYLFIGIGLLLLILVIINVSSSVLQEKRICH